MAEQAARMFGVQGLEVVKMGAMALDHLARRRPRPRRNLSLRIGGLRIEPDLGTLGAVARVGERLGLRVGAAALQAKLAELGITAPVIAEVEHELNREGLSLGQLAKPRPQPGTLAALTTSALMGQRAANAVT